MADPENTTRQLDLEAEFRRVEGLLDALEESIRRLAEHFLLVIERKHNEVR